MYKMKIKKDISKDNLVTHLVSPRDHGHNLGFIPIFIEIVDRS